MIYLIYLLLMPLSLFATTKIAIIGDSISKGFGATPGHGWVDVLQQRYINESKDIQLLNYSYNKATTDTLFDIGITTITRDRPDYIIVFLGINDAALNVSQTNLQANFSNMMSRCWLNCARIVLGGITCSFNSSYNTTLANVYTYLIPTFNLAPVMLLGSDVLAHCPDGIHPDDTGAQMISDKVYDVMHNIGLY